MYKCVLRNNTEVREDISSTLVSLIEKEGFSGVDFYDDRLGSKRSAKFSWDDVLNKVSSEKRGDCGIKTETVGIDNLLNFVREDIGGYDSVSYRARDGKSNVSIEKGFGQITVTSDRSDYIARFAGISAKNPFDPLKNVIYAYVGQMTIDNRSLVVKMGANLPGFCKELICFAVNTILGRERNAGRYIIP